MLRIDVNKPDGIAADNPFVGRSDAKPQIWAYGLRNPWRCSFDMGGDQGALLRRRAAELLRGGRHHRQGRQLGWRRMEGDKCFDYQKPDNHPASCDKTGLTMPIMIYNELHGRDSRAAWASR